MAAGNDRLMLDTNAVSGLLKGLSPRLHAWVREQSCCLSSIVVAEIRHGLDKLSTAARIHSLEAW
jgi:tRNA(fMet)-specific endonuclease VapC